MLPEAGKVIGVPSAVTASICNIAFVPGNFGTLGRKFNI